MGKWHHSWWSKYRTEHCGSFRHEHEYESTNQVIWSDKRDTHYKYSPSTLDQVDSTSQSTGVHTRHTGQIDLGPHAGSGSCTHQGFRCRDYCLVHRYSQWVLPMTRICQWKHWSSLSIPWNVTLRVHWTWLTDSGPMSPRGQIQIPWATKNRFMSFEPKRNRFRSFQSQRTDLNPFSPRGQIQVCWAPGKRFRSFTP